MELGLITTFNNLDQFAFSVYVPKYFANMDIACILLEKRTHWSLSRVLRSTS